MRIALVLILSPSDIAALPTCAAELRASGVERLWLIHNPSIGITNESTLKTFTDRIATVKQKQKEAAAREDYDAAKNFRLEVESIELERDQALREGWKSVPDLERNKAYDKALEAFTGFPAVMSTVLREDYQPDGVFAMLNGLLSTWPAEVPHGEFSLIWPRNCTIPSSSVSTALTEWKEKTGRQNFEQRSVEAKAVTQKPATIPSTTDIPSDLSKLTYMQAVSVAKDLGLNIHRKKLPEIIEMIRAKQSEAVAA